MTLLIFLAFIALGIVTGARAVLAATHRIDSIISDGLQEIDFELWEAS